MNALPILTTCLLSLPAVAAEDALKKEVARFQGTWVVEKLVYNNQDKTEKYPFKMVFKGTEATIVGNDEVKKEYAKLTLKLDPSTMPRIVDVTVGGGTQKGAVIEGIYELKDDQLKICAKVLGTGRPTKFESPEGESIALLVLKKQKN